jgi:hypothetical protein
MPIQIGDDPEPPPTLAKKLAPWLRRTLIGGCLIWVCFSMQTFLEDTRTHTIKVVYPLLMDHEAITAPQPGFDPKLAVWKPAASAFPVSDGAVVFIQVDGATYAAKIGRETIQPENITYAWLKIGSRDPVVEGSSHEFPDGLKLPTCTVPWSAHRDGDGFLYLDDAFMSGRDSRYTVGVPFATGELESFRAAVPPGTHFESVPWKIAPAPTEDIIPAP